MLCQNRTQESHAYMGFVSTGSVIPDNAETVGNKFETTKAREESPSPSRGILFPTNKIPSTLSYFLVYLTTLCQLSCLNKVE
jgi:hypothetical protein